MANTALQRLTQAVLTNKSGGSVAQGDVVIIDSTTASSFTTTTTAAFVNGVVGVVIEPNGIASNATGMVAFSGPVPKVNLSGSASLGDLFKTHSVAKQAVRHAAGIQAGDFGIVLATGTTPPALLWGLPAGATGAGSGDFVGPASAVDGHLVGFDGTTGKLGKDLGALAYPQDVIRFINQFKIAAGVTGGFTKGADTAQMFNVQYYQATPANGDAVQTTVVLKAGVYDVYILGLKSNTRGKIDWDMDGAAPFISGQDWYNATPVQNFIATGTVTIATSGRHVLQATVNGKNASSSNYYMVFNAVWLVAQAQAAET